MSMSTCPPITHSLNSGLSLIGLLHIFGCGGYQLTIKMATDEKFNFIINTDHINLH